MSESARSNKGCLAALFGIFGGSSEASTEDEREHKKQPYPYRVRDAFLTPAETSFFHVLHHIVGDQAIIFSKVGLWDIFYVAQPNKHRGARAHIAQKHVDFLICRSDTLQPVVGIELDDSSHQRTDRKRRDAEVNAVFKEASLPLLHIPAKRGYTEQDLQTKIGPHLAELDSTPQHETPPAAVKIDADGAPLCPKCGTPMAVRVAKKGKHAGEKFYACSNYPNCRSIIPVKE